MMINSQELYDATDAAAGRFGREVIKRVLEQIPELKANGMAAPAQRLGYQINYKNAEPHLLTFDGIRQFNLAIEFLMMLDRTRAINRSAGSSYGLKHAAERYFRTHGHANSYISNGALIAAAHHCGFRFKRCDPQSPNVFLNVSRKSLKDISDSLSR
jgi:hypothetical protein